MHRFKHIALVLPLLLLVSTASREAQDEWAARQHVEKTSRAMFSGNPVAWRSQSEEALPAARQ